MKKIINLILLIIALFTTVNLTYSYFNTSTDIVREFNTNDYNIIVDANGGKWRTSGWPYWYGSNPITIQTNGTISITSPTRTGYNFLGFSDTSDGTIQYSNNININEINKKSIYAVWGIRSYTVNVSSIIDDTTYESGLSDFTFDVWVSDIQVADDVIDWSQVVEYGTYVRIKTNEVVGKSTYDETIKITSNKTINPTWTTNFYDSNFYLNGVHKYTTSNKYGATVSTPNATASELGYNANFYYIGGYTPRTTWIQPNYTIGFDINIAEYNCYATFGTRSVANANYQLSRLQNAGYNFCYVSGTGLACPSNYSAVNTLYNNAWNILPSSGNGYSIYKTMSCDSGWSIVDTR
ncbi:MAG: hypothetical protein Q4G04_06410 [bacterium]|nr:hypothetical protein [bacterium]